MHWGPLVLFLGETGCDVHYAVARHNRPPPQVSVPVSSTNNCYWVGLTLESVLAFIAGIALVLLLVDYGVLGCHLFPPKIR